MKIVIYTLSILAMCGCAAQTNSESKEVCAVTTKAAEQMMSSRQRGENFEEGAKIAWSYAQVMPAYRDIFQAQLIDSWRQPIAATTVEKAREVADFAEFNDYQCHKKMFS